MTQQNSVWFSTSCSVSASSPFIFNLIMLLLGFIKSSNDKKKLQFILKFGFYYGLLD